MKLKRNHDRAQAARDRVLKAARKKGKITNRQARRIGEWEQCWYHLNLMCRQKLLKHVGHNVWEPR
jgi:hypothetical protein